MTQLKITQKSFASGEWVVCGSVPQTELKQVPLVSFISINPDTVVFKFFPNPLPSAGDLNVEIKQAAEGYYTFQLLNQSGQSVYQQQIWIDAEARLLNFDVSPVAAGSYFLTVTNKISGMKFTEKIIIQ